MEPAYNAPIKSETITVTTGGVDITWDGIKYDYESIFIENQGDEASVVTINGVEIPLPVDSSLELVQDRVNTLNVKTLISTTDIFYILQGWIR